MQLPEQDGLYLVSPPYLSTPVFFITFLLPLIQGYCEGVVGRFLGTHVRFHSKLKKPIMTKRSSSTSNHSHSSASFSISAAGASGSPSPSMLMPAEGALRVLVSSPPPVRGRTVVGGGANANVNGQRRSPSLLSPEDETVLGPSAGCSSTSSASDSALDAPPQAVGLGLDREVGQPPLSTTVDYHAPAALSPTNKPLDNTHALTSPSPQPQPQPSTNTPPNDTPHRTSTSSTSTASVYDDDDGRISPALSDGEVGIGLSLLQDFAGDGAGVDDYWSDSEDEGAGERGGGVEKIPPELLDSFGDMEGRGMLVDSPTAVTPSPTAMTPSLTTSATVIQHDPHPQPATALSPTLSVFKPPPSPSPSGDETDWEGASDIYENYRYSRHSLGSGSKASLHSTSAGGIPAPASEGGRGEEGGKRQSVDAQSLGSVYSQVSSAVGRVHSRSMSGRQSMVGGGGRSTHQSVQSLSSSSASMGGGTRESQPHLNTPSLVAPAANVAQQLGALPPQQPPPLISTPIMNRKDRPAALKLELASSPLLHTSFASIGSPPVMSEEEEEEEEEEVGFEGRAGGIVVEDDKGGEEEEEAPAGSTFASESDHETVQMHNAPEPIKPASSPHPTPPIHLQIPPIHVPLSPAAAASPSTTNNPPLSPLSSFPLPPQQLHPMISELLAVQRASPKRTSLFLPHPNAPKPSNSPSPGPMYARQQSPALRAATPQTPLSPGPLSPLFLNSNNTNTVGASCIQVLQQAAVVRYAPNGQMLRTTIYGRCDFDLMSADGPVPIVFSLEPLPPAPPLLPPPSPLGMSGFAPLNVVKRSLSPVVVPSPLAPAGEVPLTPQSPLSLSVPVAGNSGNVIMRPGFSPQAVGSRPRSRSFSGFNSPSPEPLARRLVCFEAVFLVC
jgi:hypothetical protein